MANEPAVRTLKRYKPNRERKRVKEIHLQTVAATQAAEGKYLQNQVAKPTGLAKQISKAIAVNSRDARSIFEVLPETELAMDTLVASILSPNDLATREILFRCDGAGTKHDDVVAKLIDVVRSYFTERLDLAKMCVPMLEDALFKTGSYPLLIMPHTTVDDILNNDQRVSMESLAVSHTKEGSPRALGFLGKGGTCAAPSDTAAKDSRQTISMESKYTEVNAETYPDFHKYLGYSDNPVIMRNNSLVDRIHRDRSQDLLAKVFSNSVTVSAESLQNSAGVQEKNFLYGKRHYKRTEILDLVCPTDLDEKEPLLYKLPSESVVPVTIPGDHTKQVGYFIVLDGSGNPVKESASKRHWERLQAGLDHEADKSELQQIRDELMGRGKEDVLNINKLYDDYSRRLESDMNRRVQEGLYGSNTEVLLNDDTKKMMVTRALSRMRTELLFVPKELITYVAFDYNDIGVGRSLLENARILSSMRAMLLMANTYAGVRNSIPTTLLDIELDSRDDDPEATIESIVTRSEQSSRAKYPLGSMDLTDISNALNRSSVEVQVSGHPAYANTKVKSESRSADVNKPDSDLEEGLRKRYIESLGLTVEMIDTSVEQDFAATSIMANKLFVKRVLTYQDTLVYFLTEFTKSWIGYSSELLSDIEEALSEVKSEKEREELREYFMANYRVMLPSPDTDKVSTLLEEFSEYSDALDAVLPAYISEDLLDGQFDSDMDDGVMAAVAATKAYFLRNWLRAHNFMPEVVEAMEKDNKFSLVEIQTDLNESIGEAIIEYMRSARKKGRKGQDKLDKDVDDHETKRDEEEELEAGEGEGEGEGNEDLDNLDDNNDDDLIDDPNAGGEEDDLDDGVVDPELEE